MTGRYYHIPGLCSHLSEEPQPQPWLLTNNTVVTSDPSLYPPPPSQSPGALLSVLGQTLTRGLAPHGPFPNTPAPGVQGLEAVPDIGDTGMRKDPALYLPTSSL